MNFALTKPGRHVSTTSEQSYTTDSNMYNMNRAIPIPAGSIGVTNAQRAADIRVCASAAGYAILKSVQTCKDSTRRWQTPYPL